jgi:hypothetical protein
MGAQLTKNSCTGNKQYIVYEAVADSRAVREIYIVCKAVGLFKSSLDNLQRWVVLIASEAIARGYIVCENLQVQINNESVYMGIRSKQW